MPLTCIKWVEAKLLITTIYGHNIPFICGLCSLNLSQEDGLFNKSHSIRVKSIVPATYGTKKRNFRSQRFLLMVPILELVSFLQ